MSKDPGGVYVQGRSLLHRVGVLGGRVFVQYLGYTFTGCR
jgi:hypothetical protein